MRHSRGVAILIVENIRTIRQQNRWLCLRRAAERDGEIGIIYMCRDGGIGAFCMYPMKITAEKHRAQIRQMAAIEIPAAKGRERTCLIAERVFAAAGQGSGKLLNKRRKANGGSSGAGDAAFRTDSAQAPCLQEITGEGLVYKDGLSKAHGLLRQKSMLVSLAKKQKDSVRMLYNLLRRFAEDKIRLCIRQLRRIHCTDVRDAAGRIRYRLREKAQMLTARTDCSEKHGMAPPPWSACAIIISACRRIVNISENVFYNFFKNFLQKVLKYFYFCGILEVQNTENMRKVGIFFLLSSNRTKRGCSSCTHVIRKRFLKKGRVSARKNRYRFCAPRAV